MWKEREKSRDKVEHDRKMISYMYVIDGKNKFYYSVQHKYCK